MINSVTVFTPTYNRAATLPRVYESLLKQSDLDFIWLIIDDGSTDNTKGLVENWIKENKLNIEYHFKENGGKHSAMRVAYQMAKTKYIIGIDSDDELMPEAVETFSKYWGKIEESNLDNEFAEVSALTVKTDSQIVGNFHFSDHQEYIDSYWHEMVLKYHNNNEHVVCWNLSKLIETANIPDQFWYSDKVNFLAEFVLWARLGKKFKTRYINKPLRIYHLDGGDSLLRIHNKSKGHYNNLVGIKYFLDENLDYFWWNPKYFINLLLKFIVSGIELKKSPGEILSAIKTTLFKTFYIVFLPVGFFAFVYFRFIKRQYWF